MPPFLYNFFHNQTRNRNESNQFTPSNNYDFLAQSKQEEVFYKHYPIYKTTLFNKIDGYFFDHLLDKRKSSNEIAKNKLTLSTIGYILKCGYGLQSQINERKDHRTVPSAGKKYPLEIYLFLFKPLEECVPGVYHYNIKDHGLELILHVEFSKEDIKSFTPVEWLQESNVMICITGVFGKTVAKYGNRGYRFVLLEAGHVAQNILLSGTEREVSIIPIGGVNEKEVEDVIGLHSDSEKIVYTLFM